MTWCKSQNPLDIIWWRFCLWGQWVMFLGFWYRQWIPDNVYSGQDFLFRATVIVYCPNCSEKPLGLQMETRALPIPKPCPLPTHCEFICRYLFIKINLVIIPGILPNQKSISGQDWCLMWIMLLEPVMQKVYFELDFVLVPLNFHMLLPDYVIMLVYYNSSHPCL